MIKYWPSAFDNSEVISFAVNLHPVHADTNTAVQPIAKAFSAVFLLWLIAMLSYVVYRVFLQSKLLAVGAVLVFVGAFRWYFKRWVKQPKKSERREMGLVDIDRMPYWKADDFERECNFLSTHIHNAPDKRERAKWVMELFYVVDLAKHCGFSYTTETETEAHTTYHFVKAEEPHNAIQQ